jgi:hypothetical protein
MDTDATDTASTKKAIQVRVRAQSDDSHKGICGTNARDFAETHDGGRAKSLRNQRWKQSAIAGMRRFATRFATTIGLGLSG